MHAGSLTFYDNVALYPLNASKRKRNNKTCCQFASLAKLKQMNIKRISNVFLQLTPNFSSCVEILHNCCTPKDVSLPLG